jgi:ankyrin repeat protein
MKNFNKSFYRIVLKGIFFISSSVFLSAWAGSYEDFFAAINRDDAATLQQLLRRGFDPNTPSPKGEHGLMLAMNDSARQVARVLINHRDTRIDQRNGNDETPLMLASLRGDQELVQALVARGADINKPGWTALHYAATKGNVVIVRVLLDKHAYIDAESPNGSTPLMMAAMYGTPEAVKVLLEAGADPTLKNNLGLTAHEFAKRADRKESMALIAAFAAGWAR